MNEPVVQADIGRLHEALERGIMKCGVGPEEAFRIADSLTEAELAEVPTHGIMRVPGYVQAWSEGRVKPAAAEPEVEQLGVAAVRIEGGGAFGYLPTWQAVEAAADLAATAGVGVAMVRQISEFGRAAYYAEAGARAGHVSVVCQNTIPLLGPPGCSVVTHGNNPIAFAAPGPNSPLFDAAMTPRSGGELVRRGLLGLPIPLEWGYRDGDGHPTSDPLVAAKAVQPPIGGAKGFGLAVLVDLLAGIMSGSMSGAEPRRGGADVGAMVMAFNPECFGVADALEEKLGQSAERVRSHGGRWPGDRARTARDRNRHQGSVEIPEPIFRAAETAFEAFDPDPRL